MTDDDFQTSAEQIGELENALQEWDLRGDGATAQLPWLHGIIVKLMEASAQTTDHDHDTRVKLAGLELSKLPGNFCRKRLNICCD